MLSSKSTRRSHLFRYACFYCQESYCFWKRISAFILDLQAVWSHQKIAGRKWHRKVGGWFCQPDWTHPAALNKQRVPRTAEGALFFLKDYTLLVGGSWDSQQGRSLRCLLCIFPDQWLKCLSFGWAKTLAITLTDNKCLVVVVE